MKVLFFGLDYHTYTRDIIAEMKVLGATVNYVDIQPRTLLLKALRTLEPSLYDRYLEAHHAAAIKASESTAYDKVVFLQTHQMSLVSLARLRHVQPTAEFTLYNWDALSNHDYRPQADSFHRVLTFDRRDASEHDYSYLPLFCQRSMQGLRRDRSEPSSLFMVGNIVKPARYAAIESFRAYCMTHGLLFHQHLKISPVVWCQLVRADTYPKSVSLSSIDQAAFCKMVEISGGVFDFANHTQSGQTMRMMENLCTGKKIVTNNAWVKKEPCSSPDRIHVFNGTDFRGVMEFLKGPLAEPDAEFPRYHIQSFVGQLLGLDPLLSEEWAS